MFGDFVKMTLTRVESSNIMTRVERLNNLAILSIESAMVKIFDLENTFRDFAKKNLKIIFLKNLYKSIISLIVILGKTNIL